jgi:phage shock protein C
MKKLYRSNDDRWIAGVCGGLGEYFGVTSRWVRVGFVVGLVVPFVPSIPIYLLCWLLIENHPMRKGTPTKTGGAVVDAQSVSEKK